MDKFQTMPLRFRVWDKERNRFCVMDDIMPNLDEPAKSDVKMRISDLIQLDYQLGGFLYTTRFVFSQDTGFKDSYRHPIFTGDILQDDDEGYLSIPQYRDGEIATFSLDNGQIIDSLSAVARYSTVVGNIWQNPELSEGE